MHDHGCLTELYAVEDESDGSRRRVDAPRSADNDREIQAFKSIYLWRILFL